MIAGYESLVTINGTGISGASISSFSSSNNMTLIQNLGTGLFVSDSRGNRFQEGFSVSKFSVTKPLCISGGEPIKDLINSLQSVSGTIQDSITSISFTSGYLEKYNVNYSLQEGPNITFDFLVFGEVSNNRVSSPDYFQNQPFFAKRSWIDLSISGASGILTDFSYSVQRPIEPIFVLGQLYPVEVVSIGPRVFNIRANGYVIEDDNFSSNAFLSSGDSDKVYLSLQVLGGTGSGVLIDSCSGLFSVDSRDVSISIDDEYNFSVEATRIY